MRQRRGVSPPRRPEGGVFAFASLHDPKAAILTGPGRYSPSPSCAGSPGSAIPTTTWAAARRSREEGRGHGPPPEAEADTDYRLFLQPSWLTHRAPVTTSEGDSCSRCGKARRAGSPAGARPGDRPRAGPPRRLAGAPAQSGMVDADAAAVACTKPRGVVQLPGSRWDTARTSWEESCSSEQTPSKPQAVTARPSQ